MQSELHKATFVNMVLHFILTIAVQVKKKPKNSRLVSIFETSNTLTLWKAEKSSATRIITYILSALQLLIVPNNQV